jgi:hypothetical protein
MSHSIQPTDSGAECSCGKEFNVWAWQRRYRDTSNDVARRVHLARANARRHAEAANKKETAK